MAERAILPMLPSKEEFAYAIRVVSEVMSSNGSTSQASVCGSTLSLLDAGVPMKRMVAGIAMGLIKEDEHLAILSDIQGMEDFLGDMDFKVAGTEEGITAIQMDIKISGIDEEILTKALEQARQGRLFILNKMREVISSPRPEISQYAPMVLQMKIDPEKIREVIGTGGKVINKIIDETGAKIDIEQDGNIFILAVERDKGKLAKQMIEEIVEEPEVGKIYRAKVTRLMDFGAFAEFMPGKEGLIHISQADIQRTDDISSLWSVGDEVEVMLMEIDDQGRMNLSRRAVMQRDVGEPIDYVSEKDKKSQRNGNRRKFDSSQRDKRK